MGLEMVNFIFYFFVGNLRRYHVCMHIANTTSCSFLLANNVQINLSSYKYEITATTILLYYVGLKQMHSWLNKYIKVTCPSVLVVE